MHIFTWRKRKKVFHPNGELNWNILLPSSSGMPERKCISSPQLSIHDINLHARPENTNPYFLPTKQLRPSFSHLISTASPVEETKTEESACVLSTFQTETVTSNPGPVLAKRVRSDWSVCYGYNTTPATMDKTPYERCSSAASSLREPDARRKKFTPSKRLSCPVITPIYSDESPATIPYLPITLARAPGEKLGLGLSIQTQPTTDTVDHVLIRTAPPDAPVHPGDEILVVNGVDLRTLSRSACVELFKNAPLRLNLLVRRPGVVVPEVGRNVISASPTHSCHSGSSAMDRRKVRRPSEPPPPPPPPMGGAEYERVGEEQYENIYDLPYSDKHNLSEREYHVITEPDTPRYESSYSSSCDNQPIKKHKQSDFNSNFTLRAPTCPQKVTPPDDHSHDSALNTSSGSSGSSDFTVQPPKVTGGFNPLSRSDSVSQCSYDPEYDEESVYCDTVVLQQSLDTPERDVKEQRGSMGDGLGGGSVADVLRQRSDTTALTPESLLSQKHKLRHIQPTMNAQPTSLPSIPLKDFILACDDLPETSVDEWDGDAGTKKVTFASESPVTVLATRTTSPSTRIDGAMYRAYLGLKGRRKDKRNIPNDASSAAQIRSILKTGQVNPVKLEEMEQVDNVDGPESNESGQDGVSGQTGNALITTTNADTVVQVYAVALVDHPAVDALPAHQCTADVTVHADDCRDGTVDVSDVHLESVAPKPTPSTARIQCLTKPKRPSHYTGKLDLSQLSPVPGEIYAGHCADSSVSGASTHVTRHFITQDDNPLNTGCVEQETESVPCVTQFFTKSWWKVSDKVFGSVEQEEDRVTFPVDISGSIVLDTAENWQSSPRTPPPQPPTEGHIPPACSDLSSRLLRPHAGPKPIPPPKPKFLSCRLTANKTPVKTNINTDKIHSPLPAAAASAMWQQCNNISRHLNGPLIDNNTPSQSSSSDSLDDGVVAPCSSDFYHVNHPPHFPHDSLATELVATKTHLHRATYIECVDTDQTDRMTELIDFSDHPTALPPPPDFSGGDLTLLDFSSDFLPHSMEFSSNPAQSDSPFYLEAMRASTDSGNYPDLGTVVSESASFNTCSLSVSTTSDTSDTEDNFSVSLRRDSSSSETDGHPYDVEVLHMNWDIGLKVTPDRKGRWMVRDISRTSPLLRLGNVKPGDYVLKINGQSLRGMGEGEVGTLIRALPRGLVQMTVVGGGGEKGMEKRDSLVTMDSVSSSDPDTTYSLTDTIAPADMASRHSYSYSREVNYGMTRNVEPQVQSSTVIQPIGRTEITRAKSIHMNEPTEFIVKIQKDPSMEAPSRGLAALRQHSNSFHYDPPTEPVFELEEERPGRKVDFDERVKKTSGNGDMQKVHSMDPYKHDTNDRSSKFDAGDRLKKFSNGATPSPAPQKPAVDPYKINRDFISDDFKKKREKFLGQSMDADHGKVNGKVNVALSVADRRSRFAGSDSQSMPQAPPMPVPLKGGFDRQPSVHKVETPSTNGSRSIPPVMNRPSVFQAKNEPPLTQTRAWNRDRHRSSSISSVESLSNSVNSFSSSDPSRHELSERRSSIRDEPVPERKISMPKPSESLDRGRISPAQLSRQLAKSSVSASHTSLNAAGTTGGKFAEALARYKAKTDDGSERRGSKPLIIPVAKSSVMSRATLFEQKSVDAAGAVGAPVPLSVGGKSRSVSQSSLPGSGMREWSGGRNGGGKGGVLQTQVEEEAEMGNWRKPSKSDMVTPEPTANEIPYTPRPRSIPPEPVHEVYMPRRSHMDTQPRDSPTVVRTVRDSGVSSSSSSVGDSPPPPSSPEHKLINTSNRLSVNYADLPIPTEEFLQAPAMPVSPAPIPLAAVGAQVAAVQSGPGRQAEVARKVRSVSRERRGDEAKNGSVIEGVEEGGQQMVEMGKRLLGVEAQDCDVVVVTLTRPDGNGGGGVGVVLTGGADSENNHIKINKVITHSLAHRDGRIQAGDRLLLINGQPCTNMTHRQALDVLKAPAPHVSLVLARYH